MLRNCCRYFYLALCLLFFGPWLHAEVTLPSVLADHMVIQRDRPVHLWGSADPGEHVAVSFRGHQGTTTADELGRWGIYLPPGEAGGPFTLTVQGKNTITWNDILVGDVWIASGQSNMEFPMLRSDGFGGTNNAAKEVAAANYPHLRLFHAEHATSDYPMTDIAAKTWTACTPQSVADFSAVAYFFGREILEKEKVPIGLIETDWGGTPAEAWTSLTALGANAGLMPVFAERAEMMRDESDVLLRKQYDKKIQAADLAAGRPPRKFPWYPSEKSWRPAALFNAMVAPFTPLPIRGVIWYQGEANGHGTLAPLYYTLFPTLIQDWRSHWAQGNFPFLFVQIANFNTDDDWPTVRDAQRRALALRNTGMAVTIDIGNPDDVHPTDKQDVGHRLALWARVLTYGEHIEDSGPLFRQAVPEDGKMRIWFDHDASGLTVHGDQLTGFEVAGADGKFFPASARIDGNSIVAGSDSVPDPQYVRYGWANNPRCNLFNAGGLPASPFTSQP